MFIFLLFALCPPRPHPQKEKKNKKDFLFYKSFVFYVYIFWS